MKELDSLNNQFITLNRLTAFYNIVEILNYETITESSELYLRFVMDITFQHIVV